MSEEQAKKEIFEARKWRFNEQTNSVEIVIDENGTEKILTLPKEDFLQVIETMPEFIEEKMIYELLVKLYKIKEQKMLSIADINKHCTDLTKIHENIRTELKTADKIQILRLSAASKDTANEKVVLDEQRQLVKMLTVEEARMRARIAEIRAGKK